MAERLGDGQQDQKESQDLQPTVESHSNPLEALRTEQGVDEIEADSDGNGSAQKVIEQHDDLLEGSQPRAGARVGQGQREEGQGGEQENGVGHGVVSLLDEGYASRMPGFLAAIPGAKGGSGTAAACIVQPTPPRELHSARQLTGALAAADGLSLVFGARKWLSNCTKWRSAAARPPSMTPDLLRPRPEDFLELVQKGKRGRLKLYIGFAAGVGKTYRMLEEAHSLRKRGVDVVVGFVESHGRAETEALVEGLEVIPRRQVEYRGVVVEEMSLNKILKRNPAVALVDELAHTNVPGSHNKKRYQDVLELLDAGINVIAALNVQHLDSLNDLVGRVTGVVVRETVPDSFLKRADQVVNLDLAVEDLQERLRTGKIYAADKVPWALEHFFTEENLTHLRELALREVAESVERSSFARAPLAQPRERAAATNSRVMACMSSNPPRAAMLLRRASRLAGRYNTDWFVVFVETPNESPERIDAEVQRHLLANIEKARELGAEVVRLRAEDPVDAILDFARSHSVGHIIVGRSHVAWWKQMLGRSVPLRLVKEGAGFDIHIVSLAEEEERP
jgi:two-component system sensor histidine kinase KdpD